jgi:ABC-type sugar transport system ATPase subunit
VLLGPSGCGKTTTLRMINRLVAPTSGKIFIAGRDTDTVDPVLLRRGIGYVIQQIGLFPNMTVAENIGVVPRLLKWEPARRAAAPKSSCRCSRCRRHTPTVTRTSCRADRRSVSASRARSRSIRRCC